MRLPDEWSIFPLQPFGSDERSDVRKGKRLCGCMEPTCTNAGKHPSAKWRDLLPGQKMGIPDGHGIGLATGARSGIVVIDLDYKPSKGINGLESLAALLGDVPPTLTVLTPSGGYHLYFRHPGFTIKNSASELGPGIDVRGDGGYVVLPDSEHDNGGRYSFLGEPPEDLMSAVAVLPDFLSARLARSPGADGAPFRFPLFQA